MVDYNKYFGAFNGLQDMIAKGYASLVYLVSMILMCFSKPIDKTLTSLKQVDDNTEVSGMSLVDLSWIFKLAFAVMGFLFVFSTDSKDTVIDQSSPEYFGLHVLLARATIFFSALIAAFIGLADVLVKVSSRMPKMATISLPSFEGEFSAYTAAFVHGATSLTIISASFLWEEETGLAKMLANETTVVDPTKHNPTSWAYLTLIIVAAYILKLWQELRHGSASGGASDADDMIGEVRDLKDQYRFKHARGPAITISVALLMYMISNLPADSHWYADIWSTPAYVLLIAYIFAVGMERIAVNNNQEWVFGGSNGVVVVGGITQALLFYTGALVGNHMTQDSIVFALGVVVLDAMRVGYGQATPESPSAMSSDKTALVYRMFQGLFGILAFTLITVTPHETVNIVNATGSVIGTEVTQQVTAPVLYGIGLASALVKVMTLLFLSKTLFKNSTENYYREIASTGLLFCSAYLWQHPLDPTLRPGWAYLFFILAILSRFVDSFTNHALSAGVDLKSYISWYKSDKVDAIDSPTSDNPRVWLTLAALISALWFASHVVRDDRENWSSTNDTVTNVTTPAAAPAAAPVNETQSSGMITAVFFIALHVAVVVAGLLSDANSMFSVFALSRSKFIRTAVATVVISSLSVAAGAINIGEAALLSSDSSEARTVLALVSYVVADTVGRELI